MVDPCWSRSAICLARLHRPRYRLRVARHATSRLNAVCEEEGVGYRWTDGELIRFDDPVAHAEAVEPAMELLAAGQFGQANAEFRRTLECYRSGAWRDAITNANAAFESVLKVVTGKHNLTAGPLIAEARRQGVIPGYMQSSAENLAKVMNVVPAVRGQEGPHGSIASATDPVQAWSNLFESARRRREHGVRRRELAEQKLAGHSVARAAFAPYLTDADNVLLHTGTAARSGATSATVRRACAQANRTGALPVNPLTGVWLPDRQRLRAVMVADGPVFGHEAVAVLDCGRVDQSIGRVAWERGGEGDCGVRDCRGHADRSKLRGEAL